MAPNNVDLLYSAGLAEQSLGRWDTALQHFRRAYTLNPRSVTAARTLAYALLFRCAPRRGSCGRRSALALEPNVVELVHTKVMMLLAQGDLAGARAAIRSALKGTDRAPWWRPSGWSGISTGYSRSLSSNSCSD